MKSIREIYKIGKGPSSSHTMGPERAAKLFKEQYPQADSFRVVLYGSLSKTGVGHGTDRVIRQVLSPVPTEIEFSKVKLEDSHPNTLDLFAYQAGKELGNLRVESVGGGDIHIEGRPIAPALHIYKETTFSEIAAICKAEGIRLSDFVYRNESADFREFLSETWKTMKAAIAEGLSKTGELPGGLGVQRKARNLFRQKHMDESLLAPDCRGSHWLSADKEGA